MTRKPLAILALPIIGSMLLTACGGTADTPTTAPLPTDTTAAGATDTTMMGTDTPMMGTTDTAMAGTTDTPMMSGTAMMTGTPAAMASGTPMAAATADKNNPPAVANAAAAKQYTGATLTYYGGAVGIDHDLDVALANRFKADTGININIVERSGQSDQDFATYQRFFQAQSTDVDVLMMDVVWPGQLASNLLDLTSALGDASKQDDPGIVANDTVGGKLVAMPWFSDFGILYYRTDLLQKYNIAAPPTTWDELAQDAKTIQDGEQKTNANFAGYVFQGKASEALTCDVMEWIASNGGGQVVDNGKVDFNNPQTIDILTKAKGWVGTISPKGVTNYAEEDARQAFQGGNAAFMRNWPYAYALGQNADANGVVPAVSGKFAVAPLPHGTASGAQSYGTVGGWALGVSKYSKSPQAATEFVRYMTSSDVQKWRALVGGYVPTMPSLTGDPAVQAAEPYLTTAGGGQRVGRPSAAFGANYNQASTAIFQGVNQILSGSDVTSQVTSIQNALAPLLPASGGSISQYFASLVASR